MTWAATAETFRCRGRIEIERRGEPTTIRCRTVVVCGTFFWVNGKRPLCARCALDEGQADLDVDLVERRASLEHRLCDPAKVDALIAQAEPQL